MTVEVQLVIVIVVVLVVVVEESEARFSGSRGCVTLFRRLVPFLQSGNKTRPDTRLPKSRAGGQGPYLRSPDHLGRSSEVKKIKSQKK